MTLLRDIEEESSLIYLSIIIILQFIGQVKMPDLI